MVQKGSRRVEIFGLGDKRQITAVFDCSMAGHFLPMKLVYKGKTPRCHPSFSFPPGWHITHFPNHWCNEQTIKDYIPKMLILYVVEKRKELKY